MTEIVENWLEWLRASKGRTPATISKYRGYLVEFIAYISDKNIDDVSLNVLEEFTGKHLFQNKRLSSKSRSAAISAIKNFYKWCHKQRLIRYNPAADLEHPSVGKRLPRAMMLSDAEKLLSAPDLDTFTGVRDTAILSLMIGCGLRRSEIVWANASWLVFHTDDKGRERLIIRVKGKGNKERLVPAPTEVLLLLRAYLGHDELCKIDRTLPNGDQVLFVSVSNRMVPGHNYHGENRRLSDSSINNIVAKHCQAVGLSPETAHPHALRHLYGKEFYESDIDGLKTKALLGHEELKTTEIYAHIAVKKLTEAVDAANPLGKINTPVTGIIPHINK